MNNAEEKRKQKKQCLKNLMGNSKGIMMKKNAGNLFQNIGNGCNMREH